MLAQFHDTIAAIATPEGRSALAIVRLSGYEAIRVAAKIVSDPSALLVARTGTSIYASVGDIDDVVVHIFRAPRSYTGEDLIEITSHGSPVIARQLLDALVAAGARQAEPGEFSRRAFFNGKIGLEEAELISLKADAESERQLRGAELALQEKYERLRSAYDQVISLIALVDAEIDFGESDHIEIRAFDERVTSVTSTLDQMLRESANRRVNTGYFTLALTGPPNVGKSSVFNALLSYERSIVSDTPGTTRDYVEAFIDVDGFRVKLVDTAGIRETEESIEGRGIELGKTAAAHADLTLRLTEPGARTPPLSKNGSIYLHNKIDLDAWPDGLRLSAISGEGLSDFHAWLSAELQARSSELSQLRMNEAERSSLQSVVKRLRAVRSDTEPPILAEELRQAAQNLGELLGVNTSEESLNFIFSKMCIGK
jgi:tRNA modification GTPase